MSLTLVEGLAVITAASVADVFRHWDRHTIISYSVDLIRFVCEPAPGIVVPAKGVAHVDKFGDSDGAGCLGYGGFD